MPNRWVMYTVTINVLGWNSRLWLAACLKAALAQTHPATSVVFIDNGSTDGSAAYVRERFPAVRIIELTDNFGYSGGHNAGIAATSADLVCCLNPDVVLESTFIERIVAAFNDSEVGSATGKLLRFAGQEESNRPSAPNPPIIDSVGIIVFRNRHITDRGSNEEDRGQYDQPEFVFGASGAAAVYRRTALDSVTLRKSGAEKRQPGRLEYFDENFFAYREDVELAWRLQVKGWQCAYVPTAIARHQRTSQMHYEYSDSRGERDLLSATRTQRKMIPPAARWFSFRNHLLLLLQCDRPHFRELPGIVWYWLQKIGYAALFEPRTFWFAVRSAPFFIRALKKRRLLHLPRLNDRWLER